MWFRNELSSLAEVSLCIMHQDLPIVFCHKFLYSIGWRERNQQDATNLMFIIKHLSQHVSGIIMPVISRTVTFTVHTASDPAPHNHSHHNQCRTPHAAVHTLVLLTMGIMMPETCWDKSLIINIRLVASCWFLSLHPMEKYVSLQCWYRQHYVLTKKTCTVTSSEFIYFSSSLSLLWLVCSSWQRVWNGCITQEVTKQVDEK